ncbi:173_t:CDS:10, partial [Ambispora gerdemannii]
MKKTISGCYERNLKDYYWKGKNLKYRLRILNNNEENNYEILGFKNIEEKGEFAYVAIDGQIDRPKLLPYFDNRVVFDEKLPNFTLETSSSESGSESEYEFQEIQKNENQSVTSEISELAIYPAAELMQKNTCLNHVNKYKLLWLSTRISSEKVEELLPKSFNYKTIIFTVSSSDRNAENFSRLESEFFEVVLRKKIPRLLQQIRTSSPKVGIIADFKLRLLRLLKILLHAKPIEEEEDLDLDLDAIIIEKDLLDHANKMRNLNALKFSNCSFILYDPLSLTQKIFPKGGIVAITSAALLNTEEAIKRIFDIFDQQKIIRDDGNWDMFVHPEIAENIITARHVNLETRLNLQFEIKETAKQNQIKILNRSSLFD